MLTSGSTAVSGLTAATDADPPFGGNVIKGPVREAGIEQSVWVMSHGGPEHSRLYGGQDWRKSVVQVRIRSDHYHYTDGIALARAVRDALHCPSSPPTGYVLIRVREPEPNYISTDQEQQHHWSLNVEMIQIIAAPV